VELRPLDVDAAPSETEIVTSPKIQRSTVTPAEIRT
jgi:hypothetical protein